eukprot:GDKI01008287.1.p1 GENE.GDKI01008287.1~~GDKI01008287.1.p1  ORF type:complete len:521 (-),score=132.76 GDKI01008287.1:20-1537(-)
MNFTRTNNSLTREVEVQKFGAAVYGRIFHPLSLYNSAPKEIEGEETISISDFQQYAVDRLLVLYGIDQRCGLDQGVNKIIEMEEVTAGTKTMKHKRDMDQLLKQHGLSADIPGTERRVAAKDAISHFILRLAYSQNKDKQEWFVRNECRLMLYRLTEAKNEIPEFIQAAGLKYQILTDQEKASLTDRQKSFLGENLKRNVYKVNFEEAVSLLARRRVFCQKGFAYVSSDDLSSLIMSKFRQNLTDSLYAAHGSTAAEQYVFSDPRIGGFVKMLSNVYMGPDFSSAASGEEIERLTLQNIETHATRSFPPCMRRQWAHLKTEHHLKHWGRLQLRLFLKGCGLTLDEQLGLWKTLMAPKVDADKFEKEHSYNLRHVYGKEGKRSERPPYPCQKIISGSSPPAPGPGECHGCPMKHFDQQPLTQMLKEYGTPDSSITQIMDLKKGHHYQLACVEYFKAQHPGHEGDGVGNHPNAFYKESVKYWDAKTKKQTGAAAAAGGAGPAPMDTN